MFQDNVIEETMTVDAKHHRHFVAKRGEVLRHIGDEFGGVVVSFPRSGVVSDKVFNSSLFTQNFNSHLLIVGRTALIVQSTAIDARSNF